MKKRNRRRKTPIQVNIYADSLIVNNGSVSGNSGCVNAGIFIVDGDAVGGQLVQIYKSLDIRRRVQLLELALALADETEKEDVQTAAATE